MAKIIKNIRLSLMDKDIGYPENKDNKGNFIIRSTAGFDLPSEIYKDAKETVNFDIIVLMYKDLIEQSTVKEFDSLGLWIIFEDGTELENSIDNTLLINMAAMHSDIDAVFEFAKMTLIDES